MSPSSKDHLGRSPEGTVMPAAASSREHIAMTGRLGSGPALGPKAHRLQALRRR